jgi:hypothetical protein
LFRRVSCLTSRAGTTGTYGNTTTGHQDPALYNNQPGSAGHSSGGLRDKHQDATYPAGKPSSVGPQSCLTTQAGTTGTHSTGHHSTASELKAEAERLKREHDL